MSFWKNLFSTQSASKQPEKPSDPLFYIDMTKPYGKQQAQMKRTNPERYEIVVNKIDEYRTLFKELRFHEAKLSNLMVQVERAVRADNYEEQNFYYASAIVAAFNLNADNNLIKGL